MPRPRADSSKSDQSPPEVLAAEAELDPLAAEEDDELDDQAADEEDLGTPEESAGKRGTDTEAHRMVSTVARRAYRTATDPGKSDAEKKHAAIALGITVDKHIALKRAGLAHQKPADGYDSDEERRAGVVALGLRILLAGARARLCASCLSVLGIGDAAHEPRRAQTP